MKRWLWLPAALLLAFSACDDKDRNSASAGRDPEPAVASDSIPMARQVAALSDQTRSAANAGRAPNDEAAAGAGSRFFDGTALRNAGFAVPGQGGGVYAGNGVSSWRQSLAASTSRSRDDRSAFEPPLPASTLSAAGSKPMGSGTGNVLAAFDGFQRRMFAAAAPILSRLGWHAAQRKGESVAMTPTHFTVHHTDGDQTMTEAATAAEVRGIQQYHMDGHGWEDIGYHFLIDGAGRVIEGRPADTLGAHAGGANTDNIGIAMMGNFDKVKPTAAQIQSLTRLVSFLALKYKQDPSSKGFLEGHRHYDETDCPGKNMMAVLQNVRAAVGTQTVQLAARVNAAPKGQFVPVLTGA